MPDEQSEVTAETLLAAAEEYDASLDAGNEPPQFEVVEESAEPEGEQQEEVTEPEADEVQNDEGSLTEQPETDAPEQPKSKYANNRERLDKSWASVNDAKEENKRERADLDAARAELEKQRDQVAADQGYRDEHGHTAKDYEEAAREFEDEGNDKLANSARQKAEQLVAKEKAAAENSHRDKNEAIRQEQNAKLMEKHPELNDPNSQLYKEVAALMSTYPILQFDPYGVKAAVDVAMLREKANRSDQLEARIKELESDKHKLEKKTSVVGGFTSGKPKGERGFEDMNEDEQGPHLLRAAMAHDDSF